MSEGGFEEKAREKSDAMANCSKTILETIRAYGLTATLDFVVRISNYDPIVSELLLYFPSIARTAMLEGWSVKTDSKVGQGSPETSPLKAKRSTSRRVRRTKKR